MSEKTNKILPPIFNSKEIYAILSSEQVLKAAIGECKKSLLIVLHEADATSEHLDLLHKILKAIQFDPNEDVLTLRIKENQGFNFADLNKQLTFKRTILFGIEPRILGLKVNNQKYKTFQLSDCTFLSADRLEAISDNNQLKGALWNLIKEWK